MPKTSLPVNLAWTCRRISKAARQYGRCQAWLDKRSRRIATHAAAEINERNITYHIAASVLSDRNKHLLQLEVPLRKRRDSRRTWCDTVIHVPYRNLVIAVESKNLYGSAQKAEEICQDIDRLNKLASSRKHGWDADHIIRVVVASTWQLSRRDSGRDPLIKWFGKPQVNILHGRFERLRRKVSKLTDKGGRCFAFPAARLDGQQQYLVGVVWGQV